MLNSILVPLDGSGFGEYALPLAANLARQAGTKLHLAHVHLPVQPIAFESVAMVDALNLHRRQHEQAYLDDVSRRLVEATSVPISIETTVLDGDVASALKEHTAKVNASLVVMSTHGRGAFGRFWLGGVADQLLREMPLPVLLVRPGEEIKPDLGRAAVLRNILVPLDGGDLAEKILPAVAELAALFEATVTLLRVVEPTVRPVFLHEGSGILGLAHSDLEQIRVEQQRRQDEAQTYLDQVSKRIGNKAFRVKTRVVIDEETALGILLEASASYSDLIAIESHGRRGLPRLFLGSVADKIVRGAGVPVLIHRQSK